MKRLLTTAFLLFFCTALQGQRSERGWAPVYLERHQFQVNLLLPGFTYEFGLMPNLTAGASVGLGIATPREGYSVAPAYLVFSRYYHNLKRRNRNGRSVRGNSGNYFAIAFNHYFVEWELLGNLDNEGRDLIFLGGIYGIQRSYSNGFSFGIEAGAGHYFRNRIGNGLGPAFNLRIGWNPFAKRKQKPVWPPQED